MAAPEDGKDLDRAGIAPANPQVMPPPGVFASPEQAAAAALFRAFTDLCLVDPQRRNVAICDDQAPSRRILARALAGRGGLPERNTVGAEFADGSELIEYLRGGTNLDTIAVIVTDLEMPFKTGADVTEFVRGEIRGGAIAVVMVTGRAAKFGKDGTILKTGDDRVDELVVKGDIDEILGKPLKPADLQRAVARAIQRRLLMRSLTTSGASGMYAVEEMELAAARLMPLVQPPGRHSRRPV